MIEDQSQPVGASLTSMDSVLITPNDKYGKRCRSIIREIDNLHWIGRTKPIAVNITRSREHNGCYYKHSGSGEPISIEVSCKRNPRIELTLAHEVGHFLEGASLPGSAFGVRAWVSDQVTMGWRMAVKSTKSFEQLEQIAETHRIVDTPGGGKTAREVPPRFVSYLITEQELWARSYAQYVAIRSRNETLLGQIRSRRSPESALPLQWFDDEFDPVAREFDALFDRIGWRR